VLLSFAQFERELSSERVRDKIAAIHSRVTSQDFHRGYI
jgi:DNA invertase Pin-like site-specific DNA recombinase